MTLYIPWQEHSMYTAFGCVEGHIQFFPHKYKHQVTAQKQFFRNNGIYQYKSGKFQMSNDMKGIDYDTVAFGFVSNFIIYANTPVNLMLGVERMMGCRKPKLQGYEELLQILQYTYLSDHESLKVIFQNRWLTYFEEKPFIDQLQEYVQLPHPKKQLRVKTYDEMKIVGDYVKHMRQCEIKIKKFENAKPGKYPRVIGSYGTEASLIAPWLIDVLKNIFIDMVFDDYSPNFCKSTTRENLLATFERHVKPTHKVMFDFHSDDGLITLVNKKGTFTFNMDISSCDLSNTSAIFDFLLKVVEKDGLAKYFFTELVRQCEQDIIIVNPTNKSNKLRFSSRPTEKSGTLLTTVLNNFANWLIGYNISQKYNDEIDDLEQFLLNCAEEVGYLISLEKCDRHEDVQFLKTSFTVINGEIQMFLNLGPMLRNIGHFTGDYPGSKDEGLWQRSYKHVSGVILGFSKSGRHIVYNALSRVFCADVQAIIDKHSIDLGEHEIPVEALCARYDVSVSQINELCDNILKFKLGSFISSYVIDKIMSKDYGVKSDKFIKIDRKSVV